MRPEHEILTYHGVSMDPFDPRPEQILIGDIAHALSLLTRANGHFASFYSVAQHSLHCAAEAAARGLDARTRLYCLLHDATECYLSDLTRPVKLRLPRYRAAEEALQRVIFLALTGDLPTAAEWSQVGAVDDCLLYHEFLALRGVRVFDAAPELAAGCAFSYADPAGVEQDFLRTYHTLREEGTH